MSKLTLGFQFLVGTIGSEQVLSDFMDNETISIPCRYDWKLLNLFYLLFLLLFQFLVGTIGRVTL